MEKEKTQIDETEAIKIIKEEYNKALEQEKEKHKQELKDLEDRLNKKHAEQIKALFLDGTPSINKEKEDNNDKSFYERVEDKFKEKLKIKE